MTLQIAVLTNGFVFIGDVRQEDGVVIIQQAKNIRVWGTTKGLGQLALEGPTPKTILDEAGVIRVPYHSLIFLLDCEVEPWRRVLD